MELVTTFVKPPLDKWNKDYISPGKVGTVGDALATVRLKQSAPELEPRYQDWNSGLNTIFYGSNVQDGTSKSFNTDALGARTVERPIYRYTGYRASTGWVHQDIVPTDRFSETKMVGLPGFGWKSKVASIARSRDSGKHFYPLPGGYGPSEQTRGNQYPLLVSRTNAQTAPDRRIESVVVQENQIVPPSDQAVTRVMLAR